MEPSSPDTLLSDIGWLRRLSRSLVRDPGLAEDICQETLIAAENQGAAVGRSWLSRVARNVTVALLRRETRRSMHEDRAGREHTRYAVHRQSAAQPDRLLAEAELQRAAVDALMRLGEPYRRTLLLRYMKGLSLRATAHEMQVPVETVRTRQKRGLQMLRQILEQATGNGDGREGRGALALMLPLAVPGRPDPSTMTLWGLLLMKTKVGVACAVLLVLTALFGVAVFGFGETSDPTTNGTSGIRADGPIPRQAEEETEETTAQGAAPDERRTLPKTDSASGEATPPKTGTLLVGARWKQDRRPAAGISIAVRPCGPANERVIPGLAAARQMPRIVVTGSDGTARLQLPPGGYSVKADRTWEPVTAEVQPGEETAGPTFVLPSGLEVRGKVVDRLDRPVADAEILAFWEAVRPRTVHSLARSDAAGRFVLRGMHNYMSIGARRRGHGTSDFRGLYLEKPDENDVVTVTVRMPRAAATLTGVVLDPDGAPLADAWVKVAMPRAGLQRGGGRVTPPPSNRATDSAGHFEFLALRPGKQTLRVYASGHGRHRQEIDCDAIRPTHVTVRMCRGSTLRGRVLDDSGFPVAGADVQLPGMAFPMRTRARSDEQGRFEFEDLPAGSLDISVQKNGIGKSRVTADLPVGDTLVRDFVLHAGIVLAGRLVDERGAALSGWWVFPSPSGKNTHKSAGRHYRTDEQGRFRIPNCAAHAYDLTVSQDIRPDRPPAVTMVRDVDPKAGAGTIEVLDEWLPSAVIRGRVLGASGAPLKGARVSLQRRGYRFSKLAPSTDSDGRFETMKLPPARYVLRIQDKGHVPHRAEVVVAKNQVLDLGPVMLKARDEKER